MLGPLEARAGKPFFRIPEPLMVYQLHAGTRRQEGYENFEKLLVYLTDKYKEVKNVPCIGCRGKSKTPTIRKTAVLTTAVLNDEDLVVAEYTAPHRNQQPLVGTAGFDNKIEGPHMIRARPDNRWHIHYGMRAGGDRFLVHKADIAVAPHLFKPIIQEAPTVPKEPMTPPVSLIPESPTIAETAKITGSLQKIPGISAKFAKMLKADGIETTEDVIELGVEGLVAYKGCAEYKAKIILKGITELTNRPKG